MNADELLDWMEENQAQVWYDAKQRRWTCFSRQGKNVFQPSSPTLREAIMAAIHEAQAKVT